MWGRLAAVLRKNSSTLFSRSGSDCPKCQVGTETAVGGDRVMGVRVQCVVDRDALPGAERAITGNDWIAAAIGEDQS